MSSGVWLQREAGRHGFRGASRAGHDEQRFAFSTSTHIVFVVAPHELHRGVDDQTLRASFRADLQAARAFCESQGPDDLEVWRVGANVEVRPLAVMAERVAQVDDSWPSQVTPNESAIIEHDADLRSWPVLEEDPDGGG